MTTHNIFLNDEPLLEFGFAQRMADPHHGLTLFGPFDRDTPSQPKNIIYGIIGTSEGINHFSNFIDRIVDPIVSVEYGPPDYVDKSHFLWPPYPGFEGAFNSALSSSPAWQHKLDLENVINATRQNDAHKRAFEACNLYLEGIRLAADRDEQFGMIFCVVHDAIWNNCRPRSKIIDGIGEKVSKKNQSIRRRQKDLFNSYQTEQYEYSVDFRRQLKARSMEFGIPIQIIRESTVIEELPSELRNRGLTPLSDRAWNISTAAYYKSGGKPWRLASAREGVCYIGLAFRRSEYIDDPRTACCAAQMFLDTGDGVVFRGEFGPWYSPRTNEFHLDKKSARELLEGVLEAYYQQGGKPLTEVFIHSRSTIYHEEFEGYQEACSTDQKIIGIRVRQERGGLQMFRGGFFPVIRGTTWKIDDSTSFLFASGFKPTLLTYDGWEVPIPLRIDIQHGDASIEQVTKDIFSLTKLNYNTCKLGDSMPVTVGFSDKVGEILIGNPTVQGTKPNFKFYI